MGIMKKLVLSLSLLILIFSSSILFSQNDSTKWFRKFNAGATLHNTNYTTFGAVGKYDKNFGFIGVGLCAGYHRVFIEAGAYRGYNFGAENIKKYPKGYYIQPTVYLGNVKKITFAIAGYFSFYTYSLTLKNDYGTEANFSLISGFINLKWVTTYDLSRRFYLYHELGFGQKELDDYNGIKGNDASMVNLSSTIGLKFLLNKSFKRKND